MRRGPGSSGKRDVFGDRVLEVLYLPGGVNIVMSGQNEVFDKTVRILDALISDARSELNKHNVDVIDCSNRDGFRGEWPIWCYNFETRERYDSEILQVSFNLSVDFDECETCRTRLRSEIFQPMQLSRWQNTFESNMILQEIIDQGLKAVVLRNINLGKQRVLNS